VTPDSLIKTIKAIHAVESKMRTNLVAVD
jgi:hypothetical protein